jgi:hypothetical protein
MESDLPDSCTGRIEESSEINEKYNWIPDLTELF